MTASKRGASGERQQTLANILFPLEDVVQRRSLQKYMEEYEQAFGATDLTRNYTSMWPKFRQSWLIKHDARRWYDGLPPFAKAWIKAKARMAASDGALDNLGPEAIRLFVRDEMLLDDDVDLGLG